MLELPTTIRKERKAPYRKSEAVKDLERLANDSARMKYPTIPVECLAKRTFRDDSANGLTKCIIAYLTLNKAFCSRINNTGVYDTKLQQYRPSTSRKGLADIFATANGRSLMIEVKYGKDRQSEDQKKIETDQTESGGLYYVARDFASFKNWFDTL